jgi:hypothetical protein
MIGDFLIAFIGAPAACVVLGWAVAVMVERRRG